MLSRDAEHLYWLTRYVERIENTARMINVHSELMLDFPGDQSLGWKPIIQTMDSKKFFKKRYSEYSEISAVKFLGDDKEINLNTSKPEFKEWKWANLDDLPSIIVDFKKKLYMKLVPKIKLIIG